MNQNEFRYFDPDLSKQITKSGQENLAKLSIAFQHRKESLENQMKGFYELLKKENHSKYLTLTRNMKGEIVMISWQDDEHRILEVLWERNPD